MGRVYSKGRKMIIWVQDFFVDELIGGAELTSDALICASSEQVVPIKTSNFTFNLIEKYKNCKWIFGNTSKFSSFDYYKISQSKIEYYVIEYDYKYCKFRSDDVHKMIAKEECRCYNETFGEVFAAFLASSRHVFFMSEMQKNLYLLFFPFLQKKMISSVLSSCFTTESIEMIEKLAMLPKEKISFILKSASPIKGQDDCIAYAKRNGLKYELIGNLNYNLFLNKLATCDELIFLPKGKDTCPRVVIEAKLMSLNLTLNDNVQHKDEEWFQGSQKEIINYLKERPKFFWDKISEER